MKVFPKLLPAMVITGLFCVQAAVVLSGQDAESTQKKRGPRPMNQNEYSPVPSFSLEITADKTTTRVGEALKVDVTLTNTSDRDIFYDGFGFLLPFSVEVLDSTGKEVAGTRPIPSGGSVAAVPLHPGKSIHRPMRLDKEFKLGTPGTYLVDAVKPTDNRGNVKRSDAITVTIIP